MHPKKEDSSFSVQPNQFTQVCDRPSPSWCTADKNHWHTIRLLAIFCSKIQQILYVTNNLSLFPITASTCTFAAAFLCISRLPDRNLRGRICDFFLSWCTWYLYTILFIFETRRILFWKLIWYENCKHLSMHQTANYPSPVEHDLLTKKTENWDAIVCLGINVLSSVLSISRNACWPHLIVIWTETEDVQCGMNFGPVKKQW